MEKRISERCEVGTLTPFAGSSFQRRCASCRRRLFLGEHAAGPPSGRRMRRLRRVSPACVLHIGKRRSIALQR